MTPSGTPALTKPMNNGTAEQEQNGVTMPSDAASTLQTPSRFPAAVPGFSPARRSWNHPDADHDHIQHYDNLRRVEAKKLIASPR